MNGIYFKNSRKPFWWANRNLGYSSTIMEIIEEEIEETEFFIKENKNIFSYTLEYNNV